MRNRKKGLTFAEAVVTLALVGAVLYIFFVLFPTSLSMLKYSRNVTRALQIAEGKIEDLRDLGFNNIALNPGTYNFTTEAKSVFGRSLDSATYTVEYYPDPFTESDLKQISLAISWREGPRKVGFQMSTLMANY